MKHYLEQLGEFIDYSLSRPDVRYRTAIEAYTLERSSKDLLALSQRDIKSIAQQVGDSLYFTVVDNHSLSASDVFRLFYQVLLDYAFPSEVLYGPENHFESESLGAVTVAQIKYAIQTTAYPQVYEFNQLPDEFVIEGQHVNPVDIEAGPALKGATLAGEVQR